MAILNSNMTAFVCFGLAFASMFTLIRAKSLIFVSFSNEGAAAIVGGFGASLVFLFLLTAFAAVRSNLAGASGAVTGTGTVFFALVVAMLTGSMIHRVSVTTCVAFSLLHLYFVSRVSAKAYDSHHSTGYVEAKIHSKKSR